MAKKHLALEAERLYTQEQLSLEEIAVRLNVSVRTLQTWKTDGDWAGKRQGYLNQRRSFHEELYGFTRKLMKSIEKDIDAGEKVDSGRLYTLARLLPNMIKVKDYEEATAQAKEKDADKSGITPELIAMIEREVLGIG